MATLLDSLPPELLLEVASWLDWRSLLQLERVSDRCRDAVALHLGRLRVFRITEKDFIRRKPTKEELEQQLSQYMWELEMIFGLWSLGEQREQRRQEGRRQGKLLQKRRKQRELAARRELQELGDLLPRLKSLRELDVTVCYKLQLEEIELMDTLVAASRSRPQLERLRLDWNSGCGLLCLSHLRKMLCYLYRVLDHSGCTCGPDPDQLSGIVANCPRLTEVSVGSRADDYAASVRTALPGRKIHFTNTHSS